MKEFRKERSFPEVQAEKIQDLYDCRRGQKGVIVANGPSLRVPDLSALNGVVSFGFNRVFLAFSDTDWRPDYYLVTDRVVAEQNAEIIAELPGTKVFLDSLFPILRDVDGAIFVRPGRTLLPHPQDEPANGETRFCEEWMPGDWNFRTGTKGGNSVTYFALKLAFWIGLAQVGVIGLDHRFEYKAQRTGRLVSGNDVLIAGNEINHFHEDYRKPGDLWTTPQISRMTADFDRVGKVYSATGREVVNLTPESAYHNWRSMDFGTFIQAPGGGDPNPETGHLHPKVSVVMAVYNGESYVEEALQSIRNQTFPPSELIIVDDASTDNTGEIVQKFASTAEFATRVLRNNQNEGQGFSLGRGVSVATGNLIAFIDADDFWFPSRLQSLRESYISNPDAVLFQNQLICVDRKGESMNKFAKDYMVSGDVWQFMKSKKTLAQFTPTSGLAISRALTPEILPFLQEFRISADGYITRVSCRVGKVVADLIVGGAYRLHEANGTLNNPDYDERDHLRRLEKYLRLNYLRSGILFDECLREGGPRTKDGRTRFRLAFRLVSQRAWRVIKRLFWGSKRRFLWLTIGRENLR